MLIDRRKVLVCLAFVAMLYLSACSSLGTTPHSAVATPSVHHVVLVWLKDMPDKDIHKQRVLDGSEQLRSIPGLKSLHIGTAIASERKIVDDSFDVGLHMVFASEQAMNRYLKHPTHVAFVKSIKPQIKKLLVYDF